MVKLKSKNFAEYKERIKTLDNQIAMLKLQKQRLEMLLRQLLFLKIATIITIAIHIFIY